MIVLILLLGAILRLISLNQSFWLDEATTSNVASKLSFSEILTVFSPGDFHPPAFYLILKAWTITFGVSEVSTRVPSVLFGLATIYAVYLIGLQVTLEKSKVVALLSALFMATAPLHIYFSQEARMYSLASFFVTLTTLFFVKTLKKAPLRENYAGQGRVGEWVGFSIFLAVSVLTHYLTLFIIPVYWLAGYLFKKENSWWKKFVMSHIILIIVAALWFPTFLKQLSEGLGLVSSSPAWSQVLGKTSVKEILLVPVKFMIGRISFENKTVYGLVVLSAGLLFGYLVFRSIRLVRVIRHLATIWLWLIVPIVLAAITGLYISVFSYFRLIFVLPAFYLLSAAGLTGVNRKFFPFLLIALLTLNLVFSGIYLFNPKFHREDWRGLVRFIEKESKDKDYGVVFVADSQQEAYRYYSDDDKIVKVNELGEDIDTVWLMRYVQDIFDPLDEARTGVEHFGFDKISAHNFNGVVVWRYKRH